MASSNHKRTFSPSEALKFPSEVSLLPGANRLTSGGSGGLTYRVYLEALYSSLISFVAVVVVVVEFLVEKVNSTLNFSIFKQMEKASVSL